MKTWFLVALTSGVVAATAVALAIWFPTPWIWISIAFGLIVFVAVLSRNPRFFYRRLVGIIVGIWAAANAFPALNLNSDIPGVAKIDLVIQSFGWPEYLVFVGFIAFLVTCDLYLNREATQTIRNAASGPVSSYEDLRRKVSSNNAALLMLQEMQQKNKLFAVNTNNLAKEDQFRVAMAQIEGPNKRFRMISGLVIVLYALTVFGFEGSADGTPEPAPDQFTVEVYETFADPRLPPEIFGSLTGDGAMTRRELKGLEDGALNALDLARNDAELLWVMTNKFPTSHGSFDAFVNIGTNENAIVYLYRMQQVEGGHSRESLNQTGGQGPKVEYQFEVAQSAKDDRLLAFIAMSQSNYEAITGNTKIRIGSRSFLP